MADLATDRRDGSLIAERFRLPAEWSAQDAVLLAWPHAGTDWAPRLERIEQAYADLVAAITAFEPVLLCVPDAAVRARAAQTLATAGVTVDRVRYVNADYDDTWLRDSGPLTVAAGDAFVLLDFAFTGWGGKFDARRDDALIGKLVAQGVFNAKCAHRRVDFALEGGAIEIDGDGSVLTTSQCLQQRHPELSRAAIETVFRDQLGASRVLWLDHGHLLGDDTDAHIDTLARFAPDGGIVFQTCDDPADAHYAELARMHAEIAHLRTGDGQAYRLHPLPWPRAIHDGERRLAASYANYLVVDGGVIVPAYGDAADAAAARIIAAAHPGRRIVAVDARPLIWQNGSVHCLTMQLPLGVLARA